MLYIIDARPTLSANDMCGLILQGECNENPSTVFQFNVDVNAGPAITAPKSVTVPRNANELRIIHITDIHYDPNYMVGGIAGCPNPICCRRADGMASNPAFAAGRWGDYRVGKNLDSQTFLTKVVLLRIAEFHGKLLTTHFYKSEANIHRLT